MNKEITLSEEQLKVYEALENHNLSLFLTGRAGTGKSQLIKYFINHTKKNVVLLAPTGIAAINIGGQTINRFFRIFESGVYDPDTILKDFEEDHYDLRKAVKKLDTIIIDEISMVRVDMFYTIDRMCQTFRGNDSPFGGIQIILVGDLYQLPPVINDDSIKKYLINTYGNIYFFNSPNITKVMRAYQLKTIYRQSDDQFKTLLNNVREGTNLIPTIDLLNKRVIPYTGIENIILISARNAEADNYNAEHLAKINSPMQTYTATIHGDMQAYPTDVILRLKVGAQVMMLTNDVDGRWVNGTLATISSLKNKVEVEIQGNKYELTPFTWKSSTYELNADNKMESKISGSFTQYPIKLAWAITIHKSQGQTYDKCKIKIKHAFAHGQTYVALSRCRSFDTMYLDNKLSLRDVIIDPAVKQFMQNIR